MRRTETYVTPVLAFAGLYVVSLLALTTCARLLLPEGRGLVWNQLASLMAGLLASAGCIRWLEGGNGRIGILVAPRTAAVAILKGASIAMLVVLGAHLILLGVSRVIQFEGDGLDWWLVISLLLPAAVGEEVTFRGYVLQKLHRANPLFAIALTSLLFAVSHIRNPGIGLISFVNLGLAGVMLALMWVWGRTLWMPIAGHFVWNVLSGPVLGHELSGIPLKRSLLGLHDFGPGWLTGGGFGIEGSFVLTLSEVVAIVFLTWRIRAPRGALRGGAAAPAPKQVTAPDNAEANIRNEVSIE